MKIDQFTFSINTEGRGMINITPQINQFVAEAQITLGLCHVFLHHTSASLIFCENTDVAVQTDLEAFMQRWVKDNDALFQHIIEGPDDMPAHVRTSLTHSELSIPIANKKLKLGTWQGIFLWEHRFKSYKRQLTVTLMGSL